ncbi:HAD family hydrolase [Lysinibacter sp. HNR]|uniref:HAD family hydrolase n=1 Tax=Lysinibacter sp. HNR TaxID=3031408 RepID=UPI0024348499|nr:HAD family hydrolase [Lysinibacter sp. HNR]WGD37591.1 HAD family hydrolase [Lysinibacter sp. HNR]
MPAFEVIVFDLFQTLCHWSSNSVPSAAHVVWARSPIQEKLCLAELIALIDGTDGEELAPQALNDETFWTLRRNRIITTMNIAKIENQRSILKLCEKAERHRNVTLYNDVIPMIYTLTQLGFKWAVCSNSSPDVIEKFVNKIGTSIPAPIGIISSSRVGALKPNERMYRELKQIGAEPNQTLFVGDRIEPDILGPLRHGYWALQMIRHDDIPRAVAPEHPYFLGQVNNADTLLARVLEVCEFSNEPRRNGT